MDELLRRKVIVPLFKMLNEFPYRHLRGNVGLSMKEKSVYIHRSNSKVVLRRVQLYPLFLVVHLPLSRYKAKSLCLASRVDALRLPPDVRRPCCYTIFLRFPSTHLTLHYFKYLSLSLFHSFIFWNK